MINRACLAVNTRNKQVKKQQSSTILTNHKINTLHIKLERFYDNFDSSSVYFFKGHDQSQWILNVIIYLIFITHI